MDDLKGSCIYLTGMMGSGKSTVGKLVAEALDYDFVDRYFILGNKLPKYVIMYLNFRKYAGLFSK